MILQLLAGKANAAPSLNYNFSCFHSGFVIVGQSGEAFLQSLRLSSRLLIVEAHDNIFWAWLSGSLWSVEGDLRALISQDWPSNTLVACGEHADGVDGWRMTHRQAQAALLVAERGSNAVVQYREIALLAAALQDDLLSTSLKQAYLEPLEQSSDRGATAKCTLGAYFEAGGNVSAAAAYLGVNRATVRNRLTAIEELLGWSPDAVSAELELALKLDSLTAAQGQG